MSAVVERGFSISSMTAPPCLLVARKRTKKAPSSLVSSGSHWGDSVHPQGGGAAGSSFSQAPPENPFQEGSANSVGSASIGARATARAEDKSTAIRMNGRGAEIGRAGVSRSPNQNTAAAWRSNPAAPIQTQRRQCQRPVGGAARLMEAADSVRRTAVAWRGERPRCPLRAPASPAGPRCRISHPGRLARRG